VIDMENDLFLWFLCGCYLLGGMSIGYYFKAWIDRKGKRTGTGRLDWSTRKDYGDQFS